MIPEINRWHVIVTGESMLSDMRRATDDQLSFADASNEVCVPRCIVRATLSFSKIILVPDFLGNTLVDNLYHINVLRGALTRNIAVQFSEIRDEIMASFADEIPLTSGEMLCLNP
jgi:hypothetical protein